MSSPFQRAFSAKSPLGNHKKIQRKIDMLRNKPGKAEKKGLSSESGGGIDYEAIAKLESQLPAAKASHNQSRTEEGDARVRADEDAAQGSAAEMRSPLKKNSPLNGSYASPAGEPYVSHVAGIQGAVAAVQGALNSYMNESDANKAKRLQSRVDSRNKRFGSGNSELRHPDGTPKPTQDAFLEEVGVDSFDKLSKNQEKEYNNKVKAWEDKAKYMMKGTDGDDKWIVDPTMNKTVELAKRADAHQDAANASATKDAEIKKLEEQIELLKGK
tara:strand:+ start:1676 stop:2488 length:813 start_codon:yes stop_codon:yes gene_type:complete